MGQIRNRVISVAVGGAIAIAVPLISKLEGVEHKPYLDIAGIPTVCAGITGPDVVMGKTYSQRECDNLLMKHLTATKNYVDSRVKVKIPDTMRASFYSVAFNIGITAFGKSSILREANAGNLWRSCEHIKDWRFYTNPKTKRKEVSKGLVNRRAEEYSYCIKDLKR